MMRRPAAEKSSQMQTEQVRETRTRPWREWEPWEPARRWGQEKATSSHEHMRCSELAQPQVTHREMRSEKVQSQETQRENSSELGQQQVRRLERRLEEARHSQT